MSGPYQTWGHLIKGSLLHLETLYLPFIFKFTDTQSDPIYTQTALDRMLSESQNIVLIGPLSPQVIYIYHSELNGMSYHGSPWDRYPL